MAKVRCGLFVAAATAAFVQLHAESSVVTELSLLLDTNAVVEVAADDELTIEVISGKRGTITKKGEGVLRITTVQNKNVRFNVEEGKLKFVRYPKVAEKAFFHVDSSNPDSIVTEEENGTNFVVRWSDVRNNGMFSTNCLYSPEWRPDPENRRAFISEVKQNGLPVVDFGPLLFKGFTNEVGELLGYGATMIWNVPCPEAREVYEVISDTPDIATIAVDYPQFYNKDEIWAQSFISSSKGKAGNYRERLGTKSYPNVFYDNSNNKGWTLGCVYKDGELTEPNTYGKSGKFSPGAGFSVFGFTSREFNEEKGYTDYSTTVDSFARNYTYSCGGQRIGEYLVFTNRLTDAERTLLHEYLVGKWKNDELRIDITSVNVSDGASVEFDSAYSLNVSSMSEGSDISLPSGTLELNPLNNRDAFFHVDASSSKTLALELVNGTNFVTRWDDAFSNGVYATPSTTAFGTYLPDPENRRPFISKETLNGLPVVDFGSLLVASHTNETGYGIGYGASMKWSARMTEGCMELCAVMRDTEDIKTLIGNSNVQSDTECGPAYVCDPESTRGWRGRLKEGRTYPAPSHDHAYNDPMKRGKIFFDETKVAYKNGVPPEGYHVVNIQMIDSYLDDGVMKYPTLFKPQWFGYMKTKDTWRTFGGTRIAEYMIFPVTLSNEVRTAIYSALRTKWFADEKQVFAMRNISLGSTAALTVPWQNISLSGTLSIGGTLDAASVTAGTVEPISGDAKVSGTLNVSDGASIAVKILADGSVSALTAKTLTLAGGGTIAVSPDAGRRITVGEHPLLTAEESFAGSLEGWTLDDSLVTTSSLSLVLKDDGIYLCSKPLGTTIVIR